MEKSPSGCEIVEKFNEYFKSDQNCSMHLYPKNTAEIETIIHQLDNKSSSGVDNLSNLIVKATSPVTSGYLAELVNKSFKKGFFPSLLRKAKVIPLHKSGLNLDENNYRPISLLIVWSKNFERVMFNRVYYYFESFSLFFNKQFGFRKKHSCVDALAELTERIRHVRTKFSVNFFLHLKKAFDTLDHSILIKKLSCYGIGGNALKWFESYLHNRSQRVEFSGFASSYKEISCGVPQGSVLGPILFLIYLNDLPSVCKKLEVFLFADDTNLSALDMTYEQITADHESVSSWLTSNKLVLNLDKTVCLNIGHRASSVGSFCIENINVQAAATCKYLGVMLDCKLAFNSHIGNVLKRLSTQCGVISKLRHYVPRKDLILYYNSNTKSVIQYGLLVYGCCSYSALYRVFSLQNKILKFICFRKKRDQCSDLFEKHQILSVYELYLYELLKFLLRSLNSHHSEEYLN